MDTRLQSLIFLALLLQFLVRSNSYVIDYGTTSESGADVTEVDDTEAFTQAMSMKDGAGIGTADTTETPTLIQDPSKIQQDVVSELEGIWDYTEQLKDPGLKLSLVSLVQFTYGRLQSEPEESLGRLKYLLSQLRARLNASDGGYVAETGPQKRHYRFNDDGPDENVELLANNILEQLKNGLENYPLQAVDEESLTTPPISTVLNQILSQNHPVAEPIRIQPLVSKNGDADDTSWDKLNTVTVSPNETLEQSVNKAPCSNLSFPFDRNTSDSARDETDTLLLQHNKTIHEDGREIDEPMCYENVTKIQNMEDSWAANDSDLTSQLQVPPTHISDPTSFGPQPLSGYVDEILTKVIEGHEEEILKEEINESTTLAPSTPTPENVTINSTDVQFLDYDHIFDYEFDTDSEAPSAPLIMNFLEELTAPSEVDPIFAAASMINGTRDGLIRFVNAFTRLKKYVKIIIVFIISSGMIGFGMLLYKLLPPLLFAALLSALLPLLLLLLLDNGVLPVRTQPRTFKSLNNRNREQLKNVDSSPQVLTIILDSINKYDNY